MSEQKKESPTVPRVEKIASLVRFVRGEKVMLDADLAGLYGVDTGARNRAVKRNAECFPADFMLQLTHDEWQDLRCQLGISSNRSNRGSGVSPLHQSSSAAGMDQGRDGSATAQENENLKSQIVTSTDGHRGRRTPPHAFTEQGVPMFGCPLRETGPKRQIDLHLGEDLKRYGKRK